jgi:hypothetical protein
LKQQSRFRTRFLASTLLAVALMLAGCVSAKRQAQTPRSFSPPTVGARGVAEVEGGPLPTFTLSIDPLSANSAVPGARPIQQRNFNLRLPVGDQRLAVTGFPDYYRVTALTYGAVDALKEVVTVREGDTSELRVRFALVEPAPWRIVSGSASDGNGGTLRLTSPSFIDAPQAAVGADGAFEFPKVLPATYETLFNASPPSNADDVIFWGRSTGTSVVVRDANVSGLNVAVPPIRELRGRFAMKDPREARDIFIMFFGGGMPSIEALSTADISVEGTFQKNLPEGKYTMRIRLPKKFRVESIQLGSESVPLSPEMMWFSDGVGLVGYGLDAVIQVGPDETRELVLQIKSR